jgi:hypothetical protein
MMISTYMAEFRWLIDRSCGSQRTHGLPVGYQMRIGTEFFAGGPWQQRILSAHGKVDRATAGKLSLKKENDL